MPQGNTKFLSGSTTTGGAPGAVLQVPLKSSWEIWECANKKSQKDRAIGDPHTKCQRELGIGPCTSVNSPFLMTDGRLCQLDTISVEQLWSQV